MPYYLFHDPKIKGRVVKIMKPSEFTVPMALLHGFIVEYVYATE